MNQPENGINLFGEILTIVLKFIESTFDLKVEYLDPINHRKCTAAELFQKRGKRWYLRSESLPGNLSVRALGFDADNFFIESGIWVDENLKKVVAAQTLTYSVSDKGIGEIKDAKGRVMISSGKPVIPEVETVKFMPRMLCTVPIGDIGYFHRIKTLMILDELFENDAWDSSEPQSSDESSNGSAAGPSVGVRLEMSMGLIQSLETEQRPMLEQQQIMTTEQVMTMQQTLSMLFVYQRQIIKAVESGDEEGLAKILAEYQTKHGTKGTDSLTVFVLASKVKKIRPQLTWPNARKLARSIFYKTAGKAK